MLKEYDIDTLNPRPNPYAKELKKQITIKISPVIIEYFKAQAARAFPKIIANNFNNKA